MNLCACVCFFFYLAFALRSPVHTCGMQTQENGEFFISCVCVCICDEVVHTCISLRLHMRRTLEPGFWVTFI